MPKWLNKNIIFAFSFAAVFGHEGESCTLRWRHNELDNVSDHQPHDCLLNRLFGRRSKKTSKPRVTGLCAGNSPETGEFLAQMASSAENVSIWWRHHENAYWLHVQIWLPSQSWRCHRRALWLYIDALVQDCSNSSALAMELLQCCTKPSIYDSGPWQVILLQRKTNF